MGVAAWHEGRFTRNRYNGAGKVELGGLGASAFAVIGTGVDGYSGRVDFAELGEAVVCYTASHSDGLEPA